MSRRRHHKTHVPPVDWPLQCDAEARRLGLPPMSGRQRRRLKRLTEEQQARWVGLRIRSWRRRREMGWPIRGCTIPYTATAI